MKNKLYTNKFVQSKKTIFPSKLHILHKLPTPYNDMFFHALHIQEDIDVQVYHLWKGSWRRPWKSQLGQGYPNIYLKTLLGIDWSFLWQAWSDTNTFFLICDWGHSISLLAIIARFIRHAPVGIWADTPQEALYRHPIKKWLRQKFLKWLLSHCDVIFGTGGRALEVLKDMGASSDQVVNLPCFVDLDRPLVASRDSRIRAQASSFRESVGCKDSGVVFAINGTLVHKKGQDIGLRAFAAARQKSATPMGLLLAGEGPDRQKLEQLVDELSLKDSVVFLGWQEPEGMDAVYLASNAIVHPARYDPFPLVVLETMSWSRIIIGSDVCGSIEDRVQNSVNGFSFPSENIEALAEIIVEIANNPLLVDEVGKRAREKAEEWPVRRGVEIIKGQMHRLLD